MSCTETSRNVLKEWTSMAYVLYSVARFVIISFSSVDYMEGNVIGCFKWKDVTKIINTHWCSTELLSIVVTLCNSAIV
jgi:hypothetical protein